MGRTRQINGRKYYEVYYGTSEEDAQEHAKPQIEIGTLKDIIITKEGTRTRPYILWGTR